MLRNVTSRPILWLEKGIFHTLFTPPRPWRELSKMERLSHDQRLLAFDKITGIYVDQLIEHGEAGIFPRGLPQDFQRRRLPTQDGMMVEDWRWTSNFEPLWKDEHLCDDLARLGVDRRRSFREKFRNARANSICHARRYFRVSSLPRPTLICLHGYGGGYFGLEEKIWPLRETLDAGFDVLVMVLPHHAARIDPERRLLPPRFPSRDVRFTVEGFRQLYYDFTCLRTLLAAQGCPWVALAGMSVGGYSASLLATLEPGLGFVVPVIPLACIADLSERQNRFVGTPDEQSAQSASLRRLYSLIHPMHRAPLYPGSQFLVIAGEQDGITGFDHGQRLAQHFQSPLARFPGGHIFRPGFRQVWKHSLASLMRTLPESFSSRS